MKKALAGCGLIYLLLLGCASESVEPRSSGQSTNPAPSTVVPRSAEAVPPDECQAATAAIVQVTDTLIGNYDIDPARGAAAINSSLSTVRDLSFQMQVDCADQLGQAVSNVVVGISQIEAQTPQGRVSLGQILAAVCQRYRADLANLGLTFDAQATVACAGR